MWKVANTNVFLHLKMWKKCVISLMTEKDFVKCVTFNLENAYYIPTKIVVDNDIKIMLNNKISNLLKV